MTTAMTQPMRRHRLETASLRLLIVSDQPLLTTFVRLLHEMDPTVVVVGEAASGEEALELLPALRPTAAIIDALLPGINGFQTCQRMRERSPELRVIITGVEAYPGFDTIARHVGSIGFLPGDRLLPAAGALLRSSPPTGAVSAA